MRIRKIISVLLSMLCAAAMTLSAAAQPPADMPLIDDTLIEGYYTVMNEKFSLLAVGNGVIWMLDPDPGDWEKFADFKVYGSGDAFLVVHKEGSALYFERQDWKEPALNGGVYYAAYDNYAGKEEEIEYNEGSQILVCGHVFDNDYQVVLRQPLSAFFHINEDGNREAVQEEAETEVGE